MVAKKFVEFVLSPLGIMVLWTVSGWMLCCLQRHIRLGRKLLMGGSLIFLLYLFSPLAEYLMLGLEVQYAPMLKPPAWMKPDTIVVLSGYAEEYAEFPVTSLLSDRTVGNLAEGLRLHRLLPQANLVLSGGVLREGARPVAATMGDFLEQMGVPAANIRIEGKSRNTYENLVETRRIVGSKPFILVAQACDMRRAMAVARKLGMQPLAAPANYWIAPRYAGLDGRGRVREFFRAFAHPSGNNLIKIQWAYHEYAGYVWYRMRGRL